MSWVSPPTANLGHGVELDHGGGEGVSIGPKVGHKSKHGTVEGAVDLREGGSPRIVHIDHWNVAKEPVRDGREGCITGWKAHMISRICGNYHSQNMPGGKEEYSLAL